MSTPKTSEQKAEIKKDNYPHVISYRLPEDDFREMETWAKVDGVSVNDLCRTAVLERLKDIRGMSLNERLLYEEVARLRFVTGQCFRLLACDELDEETWQKVIDTEAKKGKEIAANLLRRAMANGGSKEEPEEGEDDG